MVIMLTGGLGYIGSHIAVALLQQGYQVIVVDNLVNATVATLDGIRAIVPAKVSQLKFIKQDLLDSEQLAALFKAQPIGAVIHLAGLKAVAESFEKPLAYYHNNLVSTMNLLIAMEAGACHKLLFSSSATVYGSQTSPVDETMSIGGGLCSPYGKTKYVIEELLGDYHRAHPDFNLVVLRYFNPVGAHPSAHIGEAPLGIPNNLLPILSKVAYASSRGGSGSAPGQKPYLEIYGNDYPTPDGTCVRDFIHVCDLADAHLSALHAAPGHHVYNVGTGAGTSVLTLLEAYQRYNNLDIPYRFAPRRQGDSAETYCSAEKIYRELGWRAQKSLANIVCDSWHWTQQSKRSAQ